MTSCINDVNSAARFGEQTIGEQTKRAARKPPCSPADLQRDARPRRHCGELSWIGSHAAQSGPKVLQRDGYITMALRINVVNYGPDSSQQKGRPKPPSRVSFDRIAYAAPATVIGPPPG
jgi:hypothetical protein